jgi:cell division protein FtsB
MTNYSKDEVEQILAENKKLKTEVKKYQKRQKIKKREFSEFWNNA